MSVLGGVVLRMKFCSATWDWVYLLRIFCETEENHGKPSFDWPVTKRSGYKLTSSQQQFGIKFTNPDVSPYLPVA
jgi:hypothetical protein